MNQWAPINTNDPMGTNWQNDSMGTNGPKWAPMIQWEPMGTNEQMGTNDPMGTNGHQ
jgi:hypothetical protein